MPTLLFVGTGVHSTSTATSGGHRFASCLVGLASIVALLLPAPASATQVYVAGSTGNNISPFTAAANGSLTPISCPGSNCTAGAAPIGVAMSPSGQYLYTSSFTPNKVSVFAVAAGGSLSPVSCSGSNCNTGAGPYGIAVSPNGQYLYTANNTGNTVSPFSIGSNGALTSVSCSGSNCNTGARPYGVAVSPNGQFLYTANNSSNSVSAFSIGSNGSLTSVSCPGSNCTTGTNPEGIAVSPNGQYLYTANRGSSAGAISVFSIGSNGSLTPVACGSGCNWGTVGAFSLAISSNGQYLYATIRNAAARVASFSINANGTLSPITCSGSNCTTGTSPGGVAVTPDSRHLYASVFATNLAQQFSIGSGGALTSISCTSPNCNVSAGPDFQSVVVSPDQAPSAAFNATAARPGQPSSFNGSGSAASAGQTVARYDWSFGDGQTASNAGPTPTHTFSTQGDYTVTLTVTDDAGCSTSRTFTGQTVSCNGTSAATASHTVSIDGTPPDAVIDSPPLGTTSNPSPTFDFHASEPGSTFECSIDTGTPSFAACSGAGSDTPATPLADGSYTFRVRATDAVGNTGPAATESFAVDTTAPPAPAQDPDCSPVSSSVSNYAPTLTPAIIAALPPTVPGVRARITVDRPAQLLITAKLYWKQKDSQRSIDLGERSIAALGTGNLRLALPQSRWDDLPRGLDVTLRLKVQANPSSDPGCLASSVERLALRTQVIRVLASTQTRLGR